MVEIAKNRYFFNSLDSLRGIAALLVVFHHMGWVYYGSTNGAVMHGYLAVDFFFILSGFVIYHSYGKALTSLSAVGRFIWLRIARLMPLHLLFLMVFVGIEFVRYIAQQHFGMSLNYPLLEINNINSFLSNLFLLHSLGLHDNLSFNVPSWSISVEFATYFIFAAAVLLLAGRARVFVIALSVVIASFSAVSLLGKTHLDFNHDYGLLRCTGGFFLGTLVYLAYEKLTVTWRASRLMVMKPGGIDNFLTPGILICLAAFLLYKPFHQYDFLFVPLAAAAILSIVLTPHTRLGKLLEHKVFTTLGKWSYSIYLSHFAIIWVVNQVIRLALNSPTLQSPLSGKPVIQTDPMVGLIIAGLTLTAVLIVSRLTYNWIEKPFRKRAIAMAAPVASRV